jgi:glutathione S-transferase
MELWSGVLSPFSTKVRIALGEKGLPCRIRDIPWSRRTLWGPKPPEFLALSPRGQVPVLVDGDLAVRDSTVIVEYLEERYPAPPLYPSGPTARARCRMLEDDADTDMATHVTALVQELFTKTDDASRDLARAQAGAEALRRRWDRLESELAGREYLCGEFTIADVATFLVVSFATTLGTPPEDRHPNLRRWVERMQARPAVGHEFQQVVEAAARA